MENNLFKYYKVLSHLKAQESNMQYIYNLEYCLDNYNRETAIEVLSATLFEFEKEINHIASIVDTPFIFIFSKDVDVHQEYKKARKTNSQIKSDICYAIDCLIIIFAVKAGIVNSIYDALKDF